MALGYKRNDVISIGNQDWIVASRVSEQLYLVEREENGLKIRSALLVIVIRMRIRRSLQEEKPFMALHPSYESLTTIADRVRWCRFKRNLTRKEVAALLGTSCATYSDIEIGRTCYIDRQLGRRISALFEIPLSDLRDPYYAFLERGQGKQIRRLQETLHMNQKQFADYLHVNPNQIRDWEQERKTISRRSWEQYFQKK